MILPPESITVGTVRCGDQVDDCSFACADLEIKHTAIWEDYKAISQESSSVFSVHCVHIICKETNTPSVIYVLPMIGLNKIQMDFHSPLKLVT